jgi:hypothetical protein
MEPEDGGDEKGSEDHGEEHADVTREALYRLVWSEPMLKVAARFMVSSSYMARICTLMNVPRPERGYWAKLAVGKAPGQPSLPEIRPGDQAVWYRSGVVQVVKRPLPQPPTRKPRRKASVAARLPDTHLLIHGAKEHFEVGRTSYWSKYLRPSKRLLVDLVVAKTGLDKALSFANALFRELEAHECRVVLAPIGEPTSRAAVDEHEVPKKQTNDSYDHSRHWTPARITAVYIGSIAIGLTVIEMSEEVEARYVNGEYIPVDQLPVPKRGRYVSDHGWTSKQDFPTGRICLQAYCPDRRAKWTKQWRETKDRELTSRIPTIIRELIEASPHIAELVAEGERKAELERIRWEDQQRKWEREEAEAAARKARKESRDDLLHIIDQWARAKRIEEFLAGAEAQLEGLDVDRRQKLRDRLRKGRELIGSTDALDLFLKWRAPDERFTQDTE